ncbi:MAG: hypothetical protein QMD86_01950 [Patescibacteria group bacterium]|nr:hypothetical protein [Patescibacteria group bacterium]
MNTKNAVLLAVIVVVLAFSAVLVLGKINIWNYEHRPALMQWCSGDKEPMEFSVLPSELYVRASEKCEIWSPKFRGAIYYYDARGERKSQRLGADERAYLTGKESPRFEFVFNTGDKAHQMIAWVTR